MNSISVVVPCYNEEKVINIFYAELKKIIDTMDAKFEILFVDDGSSDLTEVKIRSLAEDDRVKYVLFSRNFGKEAAMYAGMRYASGDFVVLMDADLQDPPHLIPEMYRMIKTHGCDCVAARRSNRRNEPAVRSIFAHSFYKIFKKITGLNVVDGARDFRMMSRKMVDSILCLREHNRFSKGIFLWVGYTTKWIEYENVERTAGITKWSFGKLLAYAFMGITAFSYAPLYIPLIAGVLMFAISLAVGAMLVIRLFLKLPIESFCWGASLVVFMFAVLLTSVGILGVYIARIDRESMARPKYIVKCSNIEMKKTKEDVYRAKE